MSVLSASNQEVSLIRIISNDSGTVLIILALAILALLSVCGLAIDGWRLFLTSRQTREILDNATSAALDKIRVPGASALCYPPKELGWQLMKKAALGSLSQNKLPHLNSEALKSLNKQTFRFNYGTKNLDDVPFDDNYTTGKAGNLNVTVIRGIICFKPDNTRLWIPIEHMNNVWCRANAVRIELTISDINSTFSQVMGFNTMPGIKLSSRYQRVPSPKVCGQYQCSDFGTLDASSNTLIPAPCPAIPPPCT